MSNLHDIQKFLHDSLDMSGPKNRLKMLRFVRIVHLILMYCVGIILWISENGMREGEE